MAKSSKPRDEATQLLRYGFVNRIGDVLLFVNRMDMKSHPDYPGLGVKVEKDMKNGTLIATVSGYPTGVTGFHLRLECNRMNVTMEQMIVVVQQMTVDYEVAQDEKQIPDSGHRFMDQSRCVNWRAFA